MPAEEFKLQNQELNVDPILDEIDATVNGLAQTFKDMGLDIEANLAIEMVEFTTDNPFRLRRNLAKPADANNQLYAPGTYGMGREEALQASFIDDGTAVAFTIQPHKYAQL